MRNAPSARTERAGFYRIDVPVGTAPGSARDAAEALSSAEFSLGRPMRAVPFRSSGLEGVTLYLLARGDETAAADAEAASGLVRQASCRNSASVRRLLEHWSSRPG